MTDASTDPKPDDVARTVPAARRLWPWFVIGFVLVFVGMSLGVTMYPLAPSGDAVIRCPLWQYYVIEAGRGGWISPGTLGPTSGGSSAATTTAVQHVLCSCIGGVVVVGMGWAVRRFRARPPNPA